MPIHLLILLAGLMVGFVLGGNFGIILCTLLLRTRRRRLSAPDINQRWAFRLIGIRDCSFQEGQRIAAQLRLQ